MYKAEPKDVKRKKSSWRISSQTHVGRKQTLSAMTCLGSTGENGRKRERKNHGFSCLLENLPYSKFNMYLRGQVLTFILILTGTTIDLPHFFLHLQTSTCKSVIQRQYSQKASKDNYFLHQLAKFLRTFVRTLVVCVCVGGTSGPHHTVYQCLYIFMTLHSYIFVRFQKITFKYGGFTDFKAFFPVMLTVYCSLVIVKILKTTMEMSIRAIYV